MNEIERDIVDQRPNKIYCALIIVNVDILKVERSSIHLSPKHIGMLLS